MLVESAFIETLRLFGLQRFKIERRYGNCGVLMSTERLTILIFDLHSNVILISGPATRFQSNKAARFAGTETTLEMLENYVVSKGNFSPLIS